jgi:hypothetical protein
LDKVNALIIGGGKSKNKLYFRQGCPEVKKNCGEGRRFFQKLTKKQSKIFENYVGGISGGARRVRV